MLSKCLKYFTVAQSSLLYLLFSKRSRRDRKDETIRDKLDTFFIGSKA